MMMSRMYLFLIVGVMVSVGCQAPPEEVGEVDHSAIEASVRNALDVMVAGMNEHDVAKIMSVYAQDVVYVGDGSLVEGLTAFTESGRAFHESPVGREWSVQVDRATVNVLSDNHALLIVSGRAGPHLSRTYSLTDLFERRGDAWLIIHEHESLGDAPTSGI